MKGWSVMNIEIMRNLDAIQIQKYQQNRYPALFIDCIEEVLPGKYAKGYKNFTYNEWFFPKHFEDEPNVPGFVQYEALAQVFLMTFLTLPGYAGKKAAALRVHNEFFRRKIVPGERLDIEAKLDSFRHGIAKGHIDSFVNGEKACCLDMMAGIPDVMEVEIPR